MHPPAGLDNQQPTSSIDCAHVYLIDDHAAVRDSLDCLLRLHGYSVQQFSSAEAFLEIERYLQSGVVLADLRLPKMNGLEMIEQIVSRRSDLHTIVLTAHGDVDAAVSALRLGAKDFIHKPYEQGELMGAISRQFEELACIQNRAKNEAEAQAKITCLTAREREVAERLSDGLSNKEIAQDLNISVRTVEMHRAKTMERLGVRNLAHLVAIMIRAGKAA